MAADVTDAISNPSVGRLEELVSELSERIEEHFVSLEDRIDTLDEAQRSSEEKRSRERRDDLTLTLFLFFLQTYLAFFLVMLDALTAGG